MDTYKQAADIILKSKHCIVFTGAGISKESGIPPFRGPDGLWSKYDPRMLELNNYINDTEASWKIIKGIFYDFFCSAEPNPAHFVLAEWEKNGIVKSIITQNIDSLHQRAGSKNVIEFHGTNDSFVCLECGAQYKTSALKLSDEVPICEKCGGKLKPNFIFFGELIPIDAAQMSSIEAQNADLILIIGTTGEVYPAAMVPVEAKQNGAFVIEINPEASAFTNKITDLFIKEKASTALTNINELNSGKNKFQNFIN